MKSDMTKKRAAFGPTSFFKGFSLASSYTHVCSRFMAFPINFKPYQRREKERKGETDTDISNLSNYYNSALLWSVLNTCISLHIFRCR